MGMATCLLFFLPNRVGYTYQADTKSQGLRRPKIEVGGEGMTREQLNFFETRSNSKKSGHTPAGDSCLRASYLASSLSPGLRS